jgi:hypothetical protein
VLVDFVTDLSGVHYFPGNSTSAVQAMRHALATSGARGPVKVQGRFFYAEGMAWTKGNARTATDAKRRKKQQLR